MSTPAFAHRFARCAAALLVAALLPACAATSAREADGALRVMTYNIKTGLGMDGRRDLARVADVIRAEHPDVVTLQEIDRGAERSGRVDEPRELGRLLGMDHAYGAFMTFQGGEYGMAALSRYPIIAARNLPLPPGRLEPRNALAIEVAAPGGAVTVVSVHLDWLDDDAERYAQAKALLEHLAAIDGPVIVAGDFNDVPTSRTLALVRDACDEVPKTGPSLTFPADAPDEEIDYVFVLRGRGLAPVSARIVDEPVASDHRPVVAEIVRE